MNDDALKNRHQESNLDSKVTLVVIGDIKDTYAAKTHENHTPLHVLLNN